MFIRDWRWTYLLLYEMAIKFKISCKLYLVMKQIGLLANLFIWLRLHLFTCMHVHMHLSYSLHVHISLYLLIYLSTNLCICSPIYLFTCQHVYRSTWLCTVTCLSSLIEYRNTRQDWTTIPINLRNTCSLQILLKEYEV